MSYLPTDFIVLFFVHAPRTGLVVFKELAAANEYLATQPKSVLLRYNVGDVGNNNPCNNWAEAQAALIQIKKKDPRAEISMMAPHRELPTQVQIEYYNCIDLFKR
ncbi:MAG: hypothetical protein NTZ49_00425 [Candidatus Parcubacteria bacterium]|nr:hypothetical protein [Candidatus Parcubacteria bacterium]